MGKDVETEVEQQYEASSEQGAYKTCSCGRVFATRADFERLPLCGDGHQAEYDENGNERADIRLELRNCSCRSTLSVEVPTERMAALLLDEDTQCRECGEFDGKHVADCHGEPCETCGCVGGHDEDVHAEIEAERRDSGGRDPMDLGVSW
jgi:hypothetical protein